MDEEARGLRGAIERLQDLYDDVDDWCDEHLRAPAGWICIGIPTAALVIWATWWLFHSGTVNPMTDPSHRRTIAGQATVQAPDNGRQTNPLPDVPWLDPIQAAQLKYRPNAVNLVWLHDGNALYAPDFSMPFDGKGGKYGWHEALANPDISNVKLLDPTSAQFDYAEGTYVVNAYQPFVVGTGNPLVIYMFVRNPDGTVELYSTSNLTKVPLAAVQASLSPLNVEIPPNPDLTPTASVP